MIEDMHQGKQQPVLCTRTTMPSREAFNALVPADAEGELSWQRHTQRQLAMHHQRGDLIPPRALGNHTVEHTDPCAERKRKRHLQPLAVLFHTTSCSTALPRMQAEGRSIIHRVYPQATRIPKHRGLPPGTGAAHCPQQLHIPATVRFQATCRGAGSPYYRMPAA